MKKTVKAMITLLLALALFLTIVPTIVRITQALDNGWNIIYDGRSVKAYPSLREYVWQKNASMAPHGPYDKIGLHRVFNIGTTPKSVLFLLPWAGASGELLISNPPQDTWTKFENDTEALYWANRGFDVYSIDFRNYFVPQDWNASQSPYLKNVNPDQLSFMANWGWDQWISDLKEAVDEAKQVSGADKIFLAGMSYGGEVAMNYATLYWKQDLKGVILLDGVQTGYGFGAPEWARIGGETNNYNLTAALVNMNTTKTWFTEFGAAGYVLGQKAMFANLSAPAISPLSGQPFINPATNKSFANFSDYNAYAKNGPQQNIAGGYSNVTQDVYQGANALRYLPARLGLESKAMVNWTNCPYLTYDFDDHYNGIGVPVLAFGSGLAANGTGKFRFVNGINNTDFTGIMLPNYGHLDVFFGVYTARDVSEPTYQWMLSHLSSLDVSAFQSVTVIPGWTWWFFTHNRGGNAPYTYQWYEGLNPVQGQTSVVLSVTKTVPGVYSFFCRVTDKDGITTTSNAVTLTVLG
jgi:pimeloyl-ACP methyl ester carboxylesterase